MNAVKLTASVKALRKNSTDAERCLWQRLKTRQVAGMKFRRQEQIGSFIVEFVCYEQRLIVEADGGQHAVDHEKDNERTAWLQLQGFAVLRFWNHEILTNTEAVMAVIHTQCLSSLSHRGEQDS